MQAPEDPHYNRRIRGTRVHALRHRIVLSVMAAGGLIGLGFHFLPPSRAFSKAVLEWSGEESLFVQERRVRMTHGLMSPSAAKIQEDINRSEETCE